MSDPTAIGSRQEAVQPSLWDRLVDDLPGLEAEVEALRRELAEHVPGTEDIDAIAEGGPREIERRADLDGTGRAKARRLWQATTQLRRLRERGIVVTQDVLREAVRRDIEMLFNIERMEADPILTDHEALTRQTPAEILADFPQVRASVVNYGVPSFSGRLSTSFDPDRLAREIRHILNVFEPRLKRDTVKVSVKLSDKTGMRIEIDGVLLVSPVPERLRLSTTIDLDNGQASTTLDDL